MFELSSKIVEETLKIVLLNNDTSTTTSVDRYEKILGSSDSRSLSVEMQDRLKKFILL